MMLRTRASPTAPGGTGGEPDPPPPQPAIAMPMNNGASAQRFANLAIVHKFVPGAATTERKVSCPYQREFEQLQELITELRREVNRCDLTKGKLRSHRRDRRTSYRAILRLLKQQPRNIGEREMIPIRRRDVRSGDTTH
jgi:hypothetical protein